MKLFIFILFFLSIQVDASPRSYGNVIAPEIRTIYDGDTFKVTIPTWPKIIGESISVRVNGIDTPELRGKCVKEKELARKAKQHTAVLLRKGKKIELRNIKRGKYFRIVADVYVDNENLADSLLINGLAKKYDGGKKQTWCK